MLEKQKKARTDPKLHFEGDTNVEEIFEGDTDDSDEEEYEEQEEDVVGSKKTMKPGPTSRSHHESDEEE
jgi:hypothetical protein